MSSSRSLCTTLVLAQVAKAENFGADLVGTWIGSLTMRAKGWLAGATVASSLVDFGERARNEKASELWSSPDILSILF